MRDNDKCNISHTPHHLLKRYSILNTKLLESLIPKNQNKYKNSEKKHLTPVVVNCKYMEDIDDNYVEFTVKL